MIKTKAKRNQRQRKKLKIDEYRQWSFFVYFDYDLAIGTLDIDDQILDDLYEIAEKWNCFLCCFLGNCKARAVFHNERLLNDGIECQKEMAECLSEFYNVFNIKVGFKEYI